MKAKRIILFLLAAMALCAAPYIYRARVDNLTRAHGGIAMPDLRETEVERIERLGARQREAETAKLAADLRAYTNCFAMRAKLQDFQFKLGLTNAPFPECPHTPRHDPAASLGQR